MSGMINLASSWRMGESPNKDLLDARWTAHRASATLRAGPTLAARGTALAYSNGAGVIDIAGNVHFERIGPGKGHPHIELALRTDHCCDPAS